MFNFSGDILSLMDYLERSFQSVGAAIGILSSRVVNICLPLKPNFFYDLILETTPGKLDRVKIIYTDCQAPSGSFVANIRKSGGYADKKETKKPFDPHEVDKLFIFTPLGSYLIPTSEVTTTRSISLSQFENFRLIPS